MKSFLENNVRYFCQGALKFNFNKAVIYTDPYRIDRCYGDADIILISHSHHDHLSKKDIEKVIKEDTIIIAAKETVKKLSEYKNVIEVAPNKTVEILGYKIKAVPAYNIIKTSCHPKENEWVGYVIKIDSGVFYYTSDTEFIPEMYDINADAIFLPLGQTYTMECVEDAVKAVEVVGAKFAIPIHYGLYEGNDLDVKKFLNLVGEKGICL